MKLRRVRVEEVDVWDRLEGREKGGNQRTTGQLIGLMETGSRLSVWRQRLETAEKPVQ